jgi:Aldehyde dehydrogenase family
VGAPLELSEVRRARGGPNSDNRIALFIRDQQAGRRAFYAEALKVLGFDPAVACERGYGALRPRGVRVVIGIISPFNFPLILSMRAVGPALATGNTVVLKPDPRTVMTGGFIVARAFEEAGLPKGVLHVLPGGAEAGEALCTDPDIAMGPEWHFGRRQAGDLAGNRRVGRRHTWEGPSSVGACG